MLFKSILAVAAMAGSALAGFDIQTGATQWWYTDDAQVCEGLKRKHIIMTILTQAVQVDC